jgi:hypothetical protein
MELDRAVQTFLRTGRWQGPTEANPVIFEKGQAYVRHNGVQIGNAGDASGGMIVRFMWNGLPVSWLRFYGPKRQTERFEMVDVPEGRHKVERGATQQDA